MKEIFLHLTLFAAGWATGRFLLPMFSRWLAEVAKELLEMLARRPPEGGER